MRLGHIFFFKNMKRENDALHLRQNEEDRKKEMETGANASFASAN